MKIFKALGHVIWFAMMLVLAPSVMAQETNALQVNGAWARSSIDGSDMSAVYFRVFNLGDHADKLLTVETDAAQMADLHTMHMDGDVMRMRPVEDGVDILAGEMVAFQPGGLHVMLMGLTRVLTVGDTLELTLTFESGAIVHSQAWISETPIPHELEPDSLTVLALQADAAGTYVGQVVNPPIQAQDFALPDDAGGIQKLSDSAGRWRVIFFGYMHCPDFCPLTLVDYRDAKALLGDAASEVGFVFISVDAVRDTPEVLRKYLDHFTPDLIGFSADDDTLRRIQPDYGFYYQRQMGGESLSVYSIDHSTRSYLIDRNGVVRASFAYATYPSAIADALRWYIENEGK